MASYQLFIPVAKYAVIVAGAHAQTQRWTYTVPAGHRAIVCTMNTLLQDANPQAFGVSNCFITLTIGGVAATMLRLSTRAVIGEYTALLGCYVPMSAGDNITFYTTNGAATNLVFEGSAIIKEYQ